MRYLKFFCLKIFNKNYKDRYLHAESKKKLQKYI